jgi:para-nitrobenzyl esterase
MVMVSKILLAAVAAAGGAALLAPLAVPGAAAAAGPDVGEVVHTDAGLVRGVVTETHRSFTAIPFAAPPVGDLRWRSPRLPQPWRGVRDATGPAIACAQGSIGGKPDAVEDCLYLNVTTARSAGRGALKPVMVWLHGGGNSYGTASDNAPHRLAVEGDVVVVTVNYRLGLFGYLNHPALPGSGAFGLEDQQAALRWVRRNAAAFGGDAHNVTLFGQSGGAFDVCAQLTAPGARGLFHRAILQSSSCSTTWPRHLIMPGVPAGGPWISQEQAQTKGLALAADRGCADPATAAACLRSLQQHELQPPESFPVLTSVSYGNRVLPQRPDLAVAAGRFHRVPILSGRTRDEGRFGVMWAPPDEATYQQILREAFDAKAPMVAAKYPASAYGSPALALAAVSTDRVYSCPQLADEEAFARRTRTYAYEFADRQAPPPFGLTFPIPTGAYHNAELLYLFDAPTGPAPLSAEQQTLARNMIRYWTRFAYTGTPNGRDLPYWPPAHNATVQSLAPGPNGIHPRTLTNEHPCGFWTRLSQTAPDQ